MACGGCCCSGAGRLNADNARFLLLAVLIALYMLCGAAVFSAIELPGERRAKQRWEERLQNFTRRHNLSRAELRDFLREYEEASVAGIRVDDIRPRWDFTGAFYFVGTVVSTIGECRNAAGTVRGLSPPRGGPGRTGRAAAAAPRNTAPGSRQPTGACAARSSAREPSRVRPRSPGGRQGDGGGCGGNAEMWEREARRWKGPAPSAEGSARGLSAEGLRADGGLRGYRRGKWGRCLLLIVLPVQIGFSPYEKRPEERQQFFQQSLLPRAPWRQVGRFTLRRVGERWPGRVLPLGAAPWFCSALPSAGFLTAGGNLVANGVVGLALCYLRASGVSAPSPYTFSLDDFRSVLVCSAELLLQNDLQCCSAGT